VISLDSVLNRIEQNNPALLSFVNKINAANELVNGARAIPAPLAGVMLDDNPYDFGFGARMVNISVSQSFPNIKSLNAKEDYLKSLADISVKDQEQLKNKIFAQAKDKYFGRYITERKIEVVNENLGLMKSMIDIEEKQLVGGMGDLSAIYKLKAKLAETETMLIEEENMANAFTVELNYLMSSDLKQTFTLDTNNLFKDYRSKDLLASKDMLEVNRSDIQKMNSEIASMKLNQMLMSTMSKPEFGVSAKHYFLAGKPDMFAVEAMVMIPFAPWSAKGYKSKVKSMGFELTAMEQDKQAMLNMADNMVNMYILELNTGYAEVARYSMKVIPAFKNSLEVSLLSYRQNTSELMKVIFAMDDLLMAKMKYLERLGDLLKAQVGYEREMQIR
jgi:outer membrane protein TolC